MRQSTNPWQKDDEPNRVKRRLPKNPSEKRWRYWYLALVLLRVAFVFLPQLGYVHPDEFFQSMEIINGDHFRLEHVRAWEFNSSMPLRSITLPFFIMRVPWSFLEFIAIYLRKYFAIEILCSYTYLVFPRLIYGLISFINDWAMYRTCILYQLNVEIRLLALASSWVMLVFGIRTFSNSLEMALCSWLLYLVAECMITTNTIVYKKEFLDLKYDQALSIGERVKIWKLKNSLPAHNYRRMFLMSSLCVAGVFNRPTFLLFGAPMIFYWLLRGMGTRTITFLDFHLRMLLFCLSALPTICFFIVTDSLYYQYLTMGEIQNLDIRIENFLFTPFNFIRYNLDATKRATHGIHSHYLHLLVNMPILFGPLGLITVISLAQIVYKFCRAEYRHLPRTQSLVSVMSASILIPLVSLSCIDHQEPRFLIPLTFPIILLHAPKLLTGFCARYPFQTGNRICQWLYEELLCTRASSRLILNLWYLGNIFLTVFFGFLHQGGFVPLIYHFEKMILMKPYDQQIHLVTSHVYNLPISLLNIPNSQYVSLGGGGGGSYYRFRPRRIIHRKDFFLYEYGGLQLDELRAKIKLIASQCELKDRTRGLSQRLFVALPSTFCPTDDTLLQHSNSICESFNLSHITYDFRERKTFYPHISTEALIHYQGLMMTMMEKDWRSIMTLNWNTLTNLWKYIGLTLYEIKWEHIVTTVDGHLNYNVGNAGKCYNNDS